MVSPFSPGGRTTRHRAYPERSVRVNSLAPLGRIDIASWPRLHRCALAAGCGVALDADEERVAAADELVALALRELVRLGVLTVVIAGPEDPEPEFLAAARDGAAVVLRAVDRALAAHGRDTGYQITAWLEQAIDSADARAYALALRDPVELPLLELLITTATGTTRVSAALHRDRLAVPEGLADALAWLLVLYAAARTG